MLQNFLLDLLPTVFEGFKFTLNKMLSTHFQVNHSLTMSSVAPSGYKFGATYVGTKQFSPSEVIICLVMYCRLNEKCLKLNALNKVFPIVLGDIDSSGNLNANIIHQFHKNLRTRCVAQVNLNFKF